MANPEHVELLRGGFSGGWNQHRPARPDLSGAQFGWADLIRVDLRNADLRWADFSGSNMLGADLSGADMDHASLIQTNLSNSNLTKASLSGANLRETNLSRAKLPGADLRGADLTGAMLVRSAVADAEFDNACVYGISVWDIQGTPASQRDLIITPSGEAEVTVDDLKVAQFIYLLLNNRQIGEAIECIGKKGVLILGRFGDRKHVLDALRDGVRAVDMTPMVFDFERPEAHDFTETVRVLAGLSAFIIADLTDPRSTPHESQAVIPDYMVPFVPLIELGHEPYAMFQDLLNRHDWVLKPRRYASIGDVVADFRSLIVDPALAKRTEILQRKAREMDFVEVPIRSTDDP